MGYNELLEKYNLLLDENNRLIKESSHLKAQLGQTKPELSKNIAFAIKTEKNPPDNKITDANHVSDVNSASNSLAKIHLFMSLFKGRDDVYAKRWENKRKESFGYAPVRQWKKIIFRCAVVAVLALSLPINFLKWPFCLKKGLLILSRKSGDGFRSR